MMNRFTFGLAALLVVLAKTADASQQGHTVFAYWKAADLCAKQAQTAYPDFSAESNAKRDAKLKECLSAGALAPRQPLSSTPR
jgi:hypothetical protein